jgi:hypothetical protein
MDVLCCRKGALWQSSNDLYEKVVRALLTHAHATHLSTSALGSAISKDRPCGIHSCGWVQLKVKESRSRGKGRGGPFQLHNGGIRLVVG